MKSAETGKLIFKGHDLQIGCMFFFFSNITSFVKNKPIINNNLENPNVVDSSNNLYMDSGTLFVFIYFFGIC